MNQGSTESIYTFLPKTVGNGNVHQALIDVASTVDVPPVGADGKGTLRNPGGFRYLLCCAIYDERISLMKKLLLKKMHTDQPQKESLKEELSNILVEARMALPGMQGLFGFQTIAIFNNRFAELPAWAIYIHLSALSLNGLAIALMMTPAAYHRLAQTGEVTKTIVKRYSGLISAAMFPLAASFALEMYVIFSTAVSTSLAGWIAAGITAALITCLWFVFPLAGRRKAN